MTVVDGRPVGTARRVRLRLRAGRIHSVQDLGVAGAEDAWLGPGLVDLQVNGLAGHDLNAARLSGATVAAVAEELGRCGVTSFLPTLITGPVKRLLASLRTVADTAGVSGARVAGIHLEGPFISGADGARGAHPRRYVRAPDWDLMCQFQEAARGLIRMVTLAPELEGADRFIERCSAAGIVVALGHSAADPHHIRAAVAAGASVATHLGNGVQPVLPRHGNLLWEQLACDQLVATLIADGIHLDNSALRVMLRAKGERACLVSDVTAAGLLPPGLHRLPVGGTVVIKGDGRVELGDGSGLLAGSVRTLDFGVAHVVRSGLASSEEAWMMASQRPARLLGRSGTLAPGEPADLVRFDWEGGDLRVRQVLRSGREIA